jgi:hypothetical protein
VTAYIIAHEAGHFLGLYHVTEAEGTLFDPLNDTATCACSACATPVTRAQCADATPSPVRARQMGFSDCNRDQTGCGGATNLMFWTLDIPDSVGLLTEQQASVLRANPLVQTTP